MNSINLHRANTHVFHHVKHNMLPEEISTLFAKALEKFEPISGHLTDSHLEELREVLAQILLIIPCDE